MQEESITVSDDRPQVIVTRPDPDGAAFAELAAAAGLRPILSPAMDIEIDEARVDLTGVGALAFTSANGVRAFAANCADRTLPAYAVGAATAAEARRVRFDAVHVASGDVNALAQLITSSPPGGRVLHVAGAARAGDLIAALEEENISAARLTLYQARARDELSAEAKAAFSDKTAIWIALFSPRTAEIFLKQLSGTRGLQINATLFAACLSDAVAQRAASGPFDRIEVAETMSAQSMVELIQAAEFSS